MNSLASTIREAIRERDLSYRAIAARAEEAGYTLSFSTVSTYATGKTRTYSRQKLEAIAVGLGMDKETFMQASGVPLLGEPFEVPEDAALLEPHERDAVRSVISAFIQNHRQEQKERGGNADSTAPITTAGDDSPAHDDELAARRTPHRRRRAGHDPEWDQLYGRREAAHDGIPGEEIGQDHTDSP